MMWHSVAMTRYTFETCCTIGKKQSGPLRLTLFYKICTCDSTESECHVFFNIVKLILAKKIHIFMFDVKNPIF